MLKSMHRLRTRSGSVLNVEMWALVLCSIRDIAPRKRSTVADCEQAAICAAPLASPVREKDRRTMS
jgi:hypothetical protein